MAAAFGTIPMVFVACRRAQNNGKVHGTWINVTCPLRELTRAVDFVLASSPEPNADEYIITAHDGFGFIPVSPEDSLQWLHEMAELVMKWPRVLLEFFHNLGVAPNNLDHVILDHLICAVYGQNNAAMALGAHIFDSEPEFMETIPEQLRDVWSGALAVKEATVRLNRGDVVALKHDAVWYLLRQPRLWREAR